MTEEVARFRRLKEATGLVCLVAAIAYACALASFSAADPSWNNATALNPPHNWIGRTGSFLADFSYQSFGLAAWILPVWMLGLGWRWMRHKSWAAPMVRVIGYTLMTVTLSAAAEVLAPQSPFPGAFEIGGVAGYLVATSLMHLLNPVGTLLLLVATLVISLYLVSTFSMARTTASLETWIATKLTWRRVRRQREEEQAEVEEFEEEPVAAPRARGRRTPDPMNATVSVVPPGLQADLQANDYADRIEDEGIPIQENWSYEHPPAAPPPSARAEEAPPWEEPHEIPIKPFEPETIPVPVPETTRKSKKESAAPTCYQLPPSRLLNVPPEREGYDSAELKEVAARIKEKLEEFNVKGNVVQINPGPVVTTFEFKPDAGVKIAKITTLSEDLCLGLQAESILIERIPGKPTVGIEVPNTRREMISLRQILESDEFQNAQSRMVIAMGKDISGRIRVSELEKMPHGLIAGSTGSGKSVMLNCLIMSILFKSTPDEVRMILVDPKRVELGIYDGIPHLLTPVITEPKKAVNALRNAVVEMERRLKLLASYGVRNIDQFNQKIRKANEKPLTLFPEKEVNEEEQEKPLPYILIVIDELADLMMLERQGVEANVIRLAQMARAVGIHLVLATQRPSVDVITGLIKANFPARISFRVATRVDSRTVLDVMGAEHLLGKGDMLFLPPGTSRLLRVHGAFVTETEISDVVDFWRAQAAPEYDESFLAAPPNEEGEEENAEEFDGNEDPMYRDAVKVVLEMGKASTSILQRRLRLGYGRAARILDMMQRDGIIGPPDGSRPREVLKRPDWLDEVEEAMR